MNTTPFVLGGPQIILLIVGLAGLGLFIYALMGLLRGEKVYHHYKHPYRTDEEARRAGWYDKPEHRHHYRYRRHYRWGHGVGGIVLLLFAILLLWMATLMQTYIGLTSNIKVAQIRATTVTDTPHMMNVELILYAQNGTTLSDSSYQVAGDEWMLQGDIIKYPDWLNIFGLHSGYKVTRLEGRFDDPVMEANNKHTVKDLNGGDDQFFKSMRDQHGWTSAFVDASYGSAVFSIPNGSYDVFVSQTGLWTKHTA